jgi:uncharacterized protein GlcG (DUF336 family)
MNSSISLTQAQAMITAAFEKAVELNLQPLCVAILDAGGHLIALARQDGASTLRPQIAIAKASGALSLGMSSRKIAEIAADRPAFIASLQSLTPNGVVPAAGGIIITTNIGEVIGAVGITGDTSDNDEACAQFGVSGSGWFSQD